MLKFHPVKTAADRAAALAIYQSNPAYFTLTEQAAPSAAMVLEDMQARPAAVSQWDKHYGLLMIDDQPVGVLDRLDGYPDRDIVYVGLLMIAGDKQGRGLGTRAMHGMMAQFKKRGFAKVRVAVVTANTLALTFWEKLGFKPVGEGEAQLGAAAQAVVVLEAKLG